jgi:hypothetical protein
MKKYIITNETRQEILDLLKNRSYHAAKQNLIQLREDDCDSKWKKAIEEKIKLWEGAEQVLTVQQLCIDDLKNLLIEVGAKG